MAQRSRQIVRMHDDVAGAFGGAQEAEQTSFKDVEIADSPDSRAGGYQRPMTQSGRKSGFVDSIMVTL